MEPPQGERQVRQTLEDIYRQHRQGLYSLALSITRQPHQAEDAVHDAFARLCRMTESPRGDPVAYVYAAVRNAALDQIRRRRTAAGSTVSIFETTMADERPTPDQVVAQQERDAMIRQIVEQLPDQQRQVVVMKIYGGLTFQQIAASFDAPLSTISSRYQRALDNMKEKMEHLI